MRKDKSFIKELETKQRKAYSPTDDEKRKVLESINVESVDSFGFYEAVVADTRLDRHSDILDKSFLDALGEKYAEGRAVVHQHSERAIVGYTFGSSVAPSAKEPEHYELSVKFYIPPNTLLSSGTEAKLAVDTGLLRRVSVSFMARRAYKYVAEDSAENLYGKGYHVWSLTPEAAKDSNTFEVFELSLVAMGAQAEAVIKDIEKERKEKDPILPKSTGSKDTKMKYFIKSLNTEVEADENTKSAIELLETEAAKVTALEAKLKTFEDAEKAAKSELIKEYVALKVKAFKNLDAEKETTKAEKLSIDDIKEEIEVVKGMQPKHDQLHIDPKGEKQSVSDVSLLSL